MSDSRPSEARPAETPDAPARQPGQPRRLTYRARQRLSRDRDYQAVFGAKARKSAGPLTVFGRPNGLPDHRLGLSIGRRVGPAVVRNRLRRRLREAFRTLGPTLPRAADGTAYDLVIISRKHEPMLDLETCQRHLKTTADQLHAVWARRSRKEGARQDGGSR